MRPFSALLVLSSLTLAGCASGQVSSTPADHPASPGAAPMPMNKSKSGVPGAGEIVPPPATRVSARYVCPMHADVTSDKPGSCPECGMALVKKDGR